MAKFAYNNVKNINISYILFELNYNYYFYMLYKKNVELYFKSKSKNKLSI